MTLPEALPIAAEKPIPARAGVGLKADHYDDILGGKPDIGWFEVHPENYMGKGGPSHHYLTVIRENYPLSLHGVGLSIGSDAPLNKDHLDRLKVLADRYQPGLMSEHLAWSTHEEAYYNDLLPVPYTEETLQRVVEHIDEFQNHIGRQILLENPSTYVRFSNTDMSEVDFLKQIAARSGCGLLLDVNNVFVSATNHGYDPVAYIDEFPVEHVGEIHLGGHAVDEDDAGAKLLIDSHGAEVVDPVWELYTRAISRAGPVPTLIEWDNDIPEWPVLFEEAMRAEKIIVERRSNAAGGNYAKAS